MSTAATRKIILDTALRVFNEQGPEAASFRQLAREAGLAYSNLCYHFPDKKRLAFAVYQRLAAGWDYESAPQADLADLKRWTLALDESLRRYHSFRQRHQEWLHYSAGVKIDFQQRRMRWSEDLQAVFAHLLREQPKPHRASPAHLAQAWLFYLFQWPAWVEQEATKALWPALEAHVLHPAGLSEVDPN